MALKGYIERRTAPVANTDIKGDAPNRIAQEQLIPRIVHQQRNAVRVNRQEFFFYRRKQAGRRCSCWAIEQSPDGACSVCYGVGIPSGYDKWGCESEVIDVSRPGLRMLNVEPDYAAQTRPVLFGLVDGATRGYVECDVDVRTNVRMVDRLDLIATGDPKFTTSRLMLQAGPDFTQATDAAVSSALANPRITFRIEMARQNANTPTPRVSHVLLRYRKLERPRVIADIPRRRKSIVLEEFGISDRFETINLVFADEPRTVSTEDMMILIQEGTRWKCIDESENRPGGILTSHDVTARLINSWENYARIPP
jgi:hypothetical protein